MKKVKLKEICEVDWGNTNLTKQAYVENGEFLGVSAGGCDGRMDYYDFEAYTPVISAIGANCGKMFLPSEPFVAIKNTITLKPRKEALGTYIYYALLDNHIPCRGGGQPFICKTDTEEYIISCPSITEQIKIVDRLDKVSSLIEKSKTQLTKLDQLIKSRFIEMFGDYDLSHTQSDWKTISEIGKVVGGATPKTNIEEYWDGEYRWITPAELDTNSGYIYDSVRKLTKAGIDSCSLQEMPINTVILSSRAPIGKVAIAGNTFYCNQGFKNIICNGEILPRYLYTILLLNTEYLNSLGRGATFKEISKSIVENIKIPVPPIKSQNQFGIFVEQVDKSKLAIQKAIDKLETLKKSLMQQYFG